MPTPEQYREARRLLGWKPADVALAAVTTSAMVTRLENGFGVIPQTRASVIAVFVARGVEFGGDGRVQLVGRRDPATPDPPLRLTGAQVREARRLLGWGQPRLALAAGIAKSTLSGLESGVSTRPRIWAAIMRILADAGIVVDEDGHLSLRHQP